MLEFYLTTTILSIGGMTLIEKAITDKLKSEGYLEISKKKVLSEKIIEILKISLYMLIPFINILLPIIGIAKFEELYEDIKNDLLKNGDIILKSTEENELEEKKETTLKYDSKSTDIYEDRYLLSSKTKTDFFARIANSLTKLENIKDKETKKNLLIRIKKVTSQFNQANEKLENIDPQKIQPLMENKVTIESAISLELTEIENLLDNILRKQERQNSDKEQFKTLYKRIEEVQKGKR
ncbi:MAG: hypothetical protein IJ501_00025 [Bacilli bacterium]|nr:hypothetical protein [Bacilli bacterium]